MNFFKFNLGYKYLRMVKHLITLPFNGIDRKEKNDSKIEQMVKIYEEVGFSLCIMLLSIY